MPDESRRRITPAEILQWKRNDTPVIRVQTARDELPGGFAMAMAPLMVKWAASSPGFGPDNYYLINNVNVSSNPVGGTTFLAAVKVPADGVESVEFVTVISKVAKRETGAGHGMLRFIFKEDKRPLILTEEGRPLANDATVRDLVVSWEAWRPPVASFDAMAGLDPDTYALTARCFVGSVRCLTDAILDRPWICYPLELPDVPHAEAELLDVSLLLGDAVARQTVGVLFEQQIHNGRNVPGDYPDPEVEEWEELKAEFARTKTPPSPIQDILDGKFRYHLLERSCITMALTSVDWANCRLHERGELGEPKRVRVAPESMPRFLDTLAGGRRSSVLLRAPALLHWLMTNQTVIPGQAHKLLDEAGLLKRKDGQIVKKHYDNRNETPYGMVSEALIY
jgi:hypothetical protein